MACQIREKFFTFVLLVCSHLCRTKLIFATKLFKHILCAGNSTVTGEIPLQRPVTLSFDVIIDLYLNRLSKQSRRRWFETPFYSLWCYCNAWIKCLMIENIPLSRVLQMPAWHKENYTPLTLCAGILLGTSGFPSQGISGVELWCFIPIFLKKMLHKQ